MDGRKYGLSCRRGFLLLESLVVVFLFSLGAVCGMPLLWNWQEERKVDLAAQTLASSIRQVELMAKNDSDRTAPGIDTYYFYCNPEAGGGGAYYTRKGTRQLRPKGRLSDDVVVSGNLKLTFTKEGFAGQSENYSLYLYTPDRKYYRQVVVAMYTGRVRVTGGNL